MHRSEQSSGALGLSQFRVTGTFTFMSMHLNWLAILSAGLGYWVVGFVWYSLLFRRIWGGEQEKHRREMQMPPAREFVGMLLASFVANLVASAAIAYLLHRTGT